MYMYINTNKLYKILLKDVEIYIFLSYNFFVTPKIILRGYIPNITDFCSFFMKKFICYFTVFQAKG